VRGVTPATILLLHSAYGLRPAVLDAARILDHAGHRVVVPDLYGLPVASPADGLALRDRIGLPELHARARRAAPGAGARLVYAGFSLGAWLAQQLANDDPSARGLLMLHGMSAPPRQRRARPLPVQLHLAHVDVRQLPELRLWQAGVRVTGHILETHVYPNTAHLFTDSGHPDHNPAAAALAWRRALAFLAATS
jgi:dienelactone hydrolase